MAAIHDLLKQITDPKLRERIAREWEDATRHKKFGLVYEQHLPEVVPIYSARPRRGDLVAKRGGALTETWRVRRIEGGAAQLVKPRLAGEKQSAGERITLPVADLIVVKQFGDPIFPTLVPMDAVQNGPSYSPWHTLIEADNYHALQLLEYLYAGKVDCIYIDPPYNSGARDWKYNNDYVDGTDGWRHSKWLSFIEKRLRLAKKLLHPERGVIVCTIDENEVHHLGILLEEVFPNFYRQNVTIVITSRGVAKQGLARVEEYALMAFAPNARATDTKDNYLTQTETKRTKNPWASLLRRGSAGLPSDRAGMVYPILIDPIDRRIIGVGESLEEKISRGELSKSDIDEHDPERNPSVAWPIRSNGKLGRWQVAPKRLKELLGSGFVKAGRYDEIKRSWSINYLKKGPISEIAQGKLKIIGRECANGPVTVVYSDEEDTVTRAKTVWLRTLHDAGTYGTTLLQDILGSRLFEFPKSIYAVKDTISALVGANKSALIVDFFAGSGTTLNAVNLLNALDEGQRRCILVTNNELNGDFADRVLASGVRPGSDEWESNGVCQSVTWPRTKFTVNGQRSNGSKLSGEYFTGNLIDSEKRRSFRHAAFVAPQDFRIPRFLSESESRKAARVIEKRKLAIVAMIDTLPQNSVTPGCRFIMSEDHKASVLFDPEATAEWLDALEEQDHITDFYIVAENDKQFKAIKAQVDDLLGPLIVQEEEKRPMSAGFPANVAYFKLDFLDKDRVEIGAAFREILPLLWMKAGAIGLRLPCPQARCPTTSFPRSARSRSC